LVSFTVVSCASTLGSSTLSPAVRSGAVTMNTTRRTSITSTSGVTLISENPRFFLPPRDIAMRASGSAVGQALGRARDQGHPTLGGGLHLGEEVLHALVDGVVGDDGRDGGEEADGRRDERLADGGGHHGERGALLLADAEEGVHDPVHRPEEPHEGPGGG